MGVLERRLIINKNKYTVVTKYGTKKQNTRHKMEKRVDGNKMNNVIVRKDFGRKKIMRER